MTGLGPRTTTTRVALGMVATAALVGFAACAAPGGDTVAVATSTLVADAAFPVALLAEPEGGFLYAERLTGRVRRVGPDGVLVTEPVASVDAVAAPDDQRGLLGLARDPAGRLFAAWTRRQDARLVVGELRPDGTTRLVWEGPVSARLANGGHLVVGTDGRLVIGVGDLLADGGLAEDPSVPNRKLLSLDPDGPPGQAPSILSSGWNNPFAVAVGEDGVVWVADNTGGAGPERIGRADRPAAEAAGLGGPGAGEVVPSALVAIGPDRLAMCRFLRGDVAELVVRDGRAEPTGRVLAQPCATGLARLADGRLVTATPDRISLTEAAP